MMFVLDTNVISELMKSSPDVDVVDWIDAQPPESFWTTSVCVFEILLGIETMTPGKKQRALRNSFEKALKEDFDGRVLNFDTASATASAVISGRLYKAGQPVDMRDVQIAGIVAYRGATLATRNIKDFKNTGIALIDSWTVGAA